MDTQKTFVAIALGGNMGDMPATFRIAAKKLSSFINGLRMAPYIVTKAVDCVPGTPDFHNTVATGEFHGTPLELLALCQDIERELGRPQEHSSRESRTIDLDIVLFGEKTVSLPNLVIPHPRMRQRRFVLDPLSQLEPDWRVPPEGKTVTELLEQLENATN